LFQGVGAFAVGQPALQPQRACQVGDRLRRLLLLAIGHAAAEQRLGHDRRRQAARRKRVSQGLRRRLGFARFELLEGGIDRRLCLGRRWLLLLRVLAGGSIALTRRLRLVLARRLGRRTRRNDDRCKRQGRSGRGEPAAPAREPRGDPPCPLCPRAFGHIVDLIKGHAVGRIMG
jgi:hypothetical protein